MNTTEAKPRITKEGAIKRIRADINSHLGKPRSRRYYASKWGVPPSTVYYWIQEAAAQEAAASS